MKSIDLNLKLAIIYALREMDLLPEFDKDAFWEKTLGEPYDDYAGYAYENVPEVIEYYQNFKIPKRLLKKIKKISWPEFDIIYDVNSQSDGEDNFFEIASLEGIETCSQLESLDLHLGLEPITWEVKKWKLKKVYVSLQPLSKLKNLKEVILEGYLREVESLLAIPSLRKLKIKEHTKVLEVEEKKLNLQFFKETAKKKGIQVV